MADSADSEVVVAHEPPAAIGSQWTQQAPASRMRSAFRSTERVG